MDSNPSLPQWHLLKSCTHLTISHSLRWQCARNIWHLWQWMGIALCLSLSGGSAATYAERGLQSRDQTRRFSEAEGEGRRKADTRWSDANATLMHCRLAVYLAEGCEILALAHQIGLLGCLLSLRLLSDRLTFSRRI